MIMYLSNHFPVGWAEAETARERRKADESNMMRW